MSRAAVIIDGKLFFVCELVGCDVHKSFPRIFQRNGRSELVLPRGLSSNCRKLPENIPHTLFKNPLAVERSGGIKE